MPTPSPSSDPGSSGPKFRRAFFRVEYPFEMRPLLAWAGVFYQVLDVSERGIRLNVEGRPPFAAGSRIRATVQFEDGVETIEGTLLRGNRREAVFTLTEGVPLSRIRREERRVIRATRSGFPPGS